MSLLRRGSGPLPRPEFVSRASARALLIVAAALACGCAKNSAYTSAADPRVADPPYRVAGATNAKPDLEGDGQEAQVPPLKKPRAEPDDPSEPYSPNYGSQPPVRRADPQPRSHPGATVALGPAVRGPIPVDLPPDFRRRLASALGD